MVETWQDPHLSRLQDEFPDTPPSIVLKADVLRAGVRFTPELAEAGAWAIPSSAFLSREDVPDGGPGGGMVSVPSQLLLEDGTRINAELDRASPYEVRGGSGGHVLCRSGAPLAPLEFEPRPQLEGTLSDGSPIERALGQRANGCVALVHSMLCEYARDHEPCAYCFLGSTVAGLDLSHLSARDVPRPRQSLEACARAAGQIQIDHVVVSGGAFLDTRLEARSYVKTITSLRDVLGPDARITAVCQAFDEDGWRRLKDVGADRVQPNLEVWAERLWPAIVPGKARAVGKAGWLQRLRWAVDVFGVGNVATNFVAGAECVDAAGFPTPEAAVDSHVEAYETLLADGIVPIFGFLTKARGTRYEHAELPPTEFFLRLGWERTQLVRQAGLFDVYARAGGCDFPCPRCVTHKTCHDYPRLLPLAG